MILAYLLFAKVALSAELSTFKLSGEVVYMDTDKFCVEKDKNKTCAKLRKEYEQFLQGRNTSVTVVINKNDLLIKD